MSGRRNMKAIVALLAAVLLLSSSSAIACTSCYSGKSDSPLVQGMNWGIFSLLVVIGSVLTAIAIFFIYLAKRAASIAGTDPSTQGELPILIEKS